MIEAAQECTIAFPRRYLIGKEKRVGKHLVSPFRDTLFGFLDSDHDEKRMSIAVGLAFSHQVADSKSPPTDLVDKMIGDVLEAMPQAFGPLE